VVAARDFSGKLTNQDPMSCIPHLRRHALWYSVGTGFDRDRK
jgi:hypothetical protein